jgi:hypothetical protein
MNRPLVAAIAGAALLIAGAGAALAQTKPHSGKPAAARKTAKPAPPAGTSAGTLYGEPGRLSDRWTIEQALPGRPSDRADRTAPAPELGRTRLQNSPGSVGFASGTVRSTEFSDGRPVPGLTQNTARDASYVGLSLSVPSDNKSFPIPLLPSPGSASGW